jgi:hypothetical protein
MAVFRLEGSDPRLMPDLSAAVVFEERETPANAARPGLAPPTRAAR